MRLKGKTLAKEKGNRAEGTPFVKEAMGPIWYLSRIYVSAASSQGERAITSGVVDISIVHTLLDGEEKVDGTRE
jgi:hypothetical protein